MDFEPEDQQIVEMLSKLKGKEGTYPKKMLASRRRVFLSQMASVGAGLGIGAGLKEVAKASKAGLFHSISASSVLESILVLAIVAQAGVIAYNYRNKIADYVNTLSVSATATEVSSPVIAGSTEPAIVISNTPTVVPTKTASPSPSSTVTTVSTSPSGLNGNNGGVTTAISTAPAQPTTQSTAQPTNGNNGNHYGQTPRPTQEPSNSQPTQGSGSSNGNGSKKP